MRFVSLGCTGFFVVEMSLTCTRQEGRMMNTRTRGFSRVILCILIALLWAGVRTVPAAEGSNDPFFKGKIIRFVVGYAPGGGFDTFARLLARHLRRDYIGASGLERLQDAIKRRFN